MASFIDVGLQKAMLNPLNIKKPGLCAILTRAAELLYNEVARDSPQAIRLACNQLRVEDGMRSTTTNMYRGYTTQLGNKAVYGLTRQEAIEVRTNFLLMLAAEAGWKPELLEARRDKPEFV